MKKKILFLVAVIALVLIPVKAEDSLIATYHNDNDKVNASAIQLGDNLKVDKDIDGIGLIMGNSISVSNKQDYLFALGNTININDASTKDLFVAGNSITVDSKNIERDAYVAGNMISINSKIPRDLFVAGNNVTVSDEVGGALKVACDTVTVKGKINGDAYLDSENIVIEDGAEVTGKLSYPEDAKITISKEAKVNEKVKFVREDEGKNKSELMTTIFDRFMAFVNLLIIGLLAIYFLKIKSKDEKLDSKYITKNMVRGLLVLLLTPMLFFVLLFFYGATIGLDFVMLALYIIMIYLSAIPAAIYLGNALLKGINNIYLRFIIMLFIFYAVRFIPVLGGICTAIILVLGLGILTYALQDTFIKKEAKK